MIIYLLALLAIMAAGAAAGIMFTIRYAEHRYAEQQAREARMGDIREPGALDSHDRLRI
jgi:type II secretory pathway component PulK